VTRLQYGVGWFNYVADHLGSARVLVKSGEYTPCYDADFLPYGEEKVYTDTCPQNYKFTGKERDAESGLDYFGARYYGSTLGRFMIPDPGNTGADERVPQSWNGYSYVGNNPLNALDPDGLDYYLVGGDSCDRRFQCDKEGFMLDDQGDRVVVTDQQVLSGEVQAGVDDSGNLTITTQQGTFGARFFDPNPGFVSAFVTGSSLEGEISPQVKAGLATAAVISQADSPAPGLADLIGLGIIVTAMANNYAMHGSLLHVSYMSEKSQINAAAREVGVSPKELRRAVEAFKRSVGMGGADNLTWDQILELAREVKAGLWKGK
jgi:RHS repeat-associated protein